MSEVIKIKVGSRKSELALIQTKHVISCLSKLHPEKEFEIVTMSTLGDKVLDVPLPKIGEKSLFTKELETALATGGVDFVVHSLKDLPTTLPEGMAIGAVLEREDPRDALVVRKGLTHSSLSEFPPNSVIGTSSLRRTAQLARSFPSLKVEDIRGNLNTRIRKLDDLDKYTAIILAQAGLRRMNWHSRITKILMCNEMMYAVGQGALAVECRQNDLETIKLLEPLHCSETLLRILAERSFLKTLGGGCSAPVAVSTKLVPFNDKYTLQLSGGVWSLDGKTEIKDNDKCTVEIKKKTTKQKTEHGAGDANTLLLLVSDNNVSSSSSSSLLASASASVSVSSVTVPNDDNPIPNKRKKTNVTDTDIGTDTNGNGTNENLIDSSAVTIAESTSTNNLLLLSEDDPHKHCPITIPVGEDFMGKCPYLEYHPTTPEASSVCPFTGNKLMPAVCPYKEAMNNNKTDLETNEITTTTTTTTTTTSSTTTHSTQGNQITSDNSSSSSSSNNNNNNNNNNNTTSTTTTIVNTIEIAITEQPLICPYQKHNGTPKLYCGLVPAKDTPLWALEQAEHLGKNLAEKLMSNGALRVMQMAQAQIRGSL